MNGTEASQANGPAQEYLTFTLGREEYAIDILRVQEIRGYDQVTAIANAPPFIKGVINLRGAIVPIVDLRIKFHLAEVTYDPFTVVIILNIGRRIVGVVVDSVSDVIALGGDAIRPPPEFGASFDTEYLLGLATAGERMLILVDIETDDQPRNGAGRRSRGLSGANEDRQGISKWVCSMHMRWRSNAPTGSPRSSSRSPTASSTPPSARPRRPATSVSTTACGRCSGNCANNAPNSSRWKAWRRGWRR